MAFSLVRLLVPVAVVFFARVNYGASAVLRGLSSQDSDDYVYGKRTFMTAKLPYALYECFDSCKTYRSNTILCNQGCMSGFDATCSRENIHCLHGKAVTKIVDEADSTDADVGPGSNDNGDVEGLADALYLADHFFDTDLPKSLADCYWYACEDRYENCDTRCDAAYTEVCKKPDVTCGEDEVARMRETISGEPGTEDEDSGDSDPLSTPSNEDSKDDADEVLINENEGEEPKNHFDALSTVGGLVGGLLCGLVIGLLVRRARTSKRPKSVGVVDTGISTVNVVPVLAQHDSFRLMDDDSLVPTHVIE